MKLLLNEPTGEDSFDGGASKRIVDEVVRQIQTPDLLFWDRDRKCSYPVSLIGLKGVWGSGKSNVIRMVKERLTTSSEYVLFEYDAWGHRQDLSRKMFLEELVEFLCVKGLVLGEWCQKVAKLTGARKDTARETTPELNWPILIYLLSFVSTPFWKLISDSCSSVCYKGVIQSIPIILGTGAFICSVGYNWFKGGSLRFALSRSLWLLKEKKIDYKATEWTHVYDPSVHCFTKFLGELLLELKKKTLIVVLDNVDRLMPKEVADFLGTIHVIFAGDRCKRPTNLKVVVPYDSTKLEAAMKLSTCKTFCAEDYASRTFDLVYRVSLPLFSEWDSFFKEKFMLSAGEDKSADDKSLVARNLVDVLLPKAELTPRKMISIINRIAQTHNMFLNEVPLEDVVLYACSWNDHIPHTEKIEEWIVNGKFIANSKYQKVYLEGYEHKLSIAQLVFQVDKKKATSVLLDLLVKQALEKGDAASLCKLYDTEGFHYCVLTAFESMSAADAEIVDKITGALVGLDNVPDKVVYWDEFYAYKRDMIEIDALAKDYLSDASRRILMNITEWSDYAAFLRTKMAGSNTTINWEKSCSMAVSIENVLRTKNRSQVQSVKQDYVAPETMLRILAAYRSCWELANVCCPVAELDAFVAKRIESGSEVLKELKTLSAVSFLDGAERLKMVETRKSLACLGIQDKNYPEFVNAYLALFESVTNEPIDVELTRDNIDSFWRWALEQNDEECLARALVLTWRYGGFPYNENKVKEYLSKGDASYARLEDIGRIWPQYFTKEELITGLESLKSNYRDEFLIDELYKHVKEGSID